MKSEGQIFRTSTVKNKQNQSPGHQAENAKAFYMIRKMLVLTILLGVNLESKCDEPWETARESDGVIFSYRWHRFGSDRFREVKIDFEVEVPPEVFMPYLKDAAHYKAWAPGVDFCESQPTENGWIMYTLLQTLWPFSQQDMVAECSVSQRPGGVTIKLNSSPEKYRQKANVSRLQSFYGSWELTADNDHKTRVTYKMLSKTKPKIPRSLQDQVVQHEFLKGIKKLKHCLATECQTQQAMF